MNPPVEVSLEMRMNDVIGPALCLTTPFVSIFEAPDIIHVWEKNYGSSHDVDTSPSRDLMDRLHVLGKKTDTGQLAPDEKKIV